MGLVGGSITGGVSLAAVSCPGLFLYSPSIAHSSPGHTLLCHAPCRGLTGLKTWTWYIVSPSGSSLRLLPSQLHRRSANTSEIWNPCSLEHSRQGTPDCRNTWMIEPLIPGEAAAWDLTPTLSRNVVCPAACLPPKKVFVSGERKCRVNNEFSVAFSQLCCGDLGICWIWVMAVWGPGFDTSVYSVFPFRCWEPNPGPFTF